MTLEEFYNILTKAGIPIAYLAFREDNAPDMPFAVYQVTHQNNFAADGKVYAQIKHIRVDLYCKETDLESEIKIESALSEIYWKKEKEYIVKEPYNRVTYEMEV